MLNSCLLIVSARQNLFQLMILFPVSVLKGLLLSERIDRNVSAQILLVVLLKVSGSDFFSVDHVTDHCRLNSFKSLSFERFKRFFF